MSLVYGAPALKLSDVGAELPAGSIPLAVPSRVRCQSVVVRGLVSRGVPAQSWPQLPPEVLGSPEHAAARELQQAIVLVPCHQDLTTADCDFIASAVCRTIDAAAP